MPRAAVATLLLGLLVPAGRVASTASAPPPPTHPRLVLVIVVDQFRYDFLERFREHFGPGGFRRLLESGASFANAHFLHATTYTAPGHVSIFTGSVPAHDGIIGNAWFDRELGRVRGAVGDSAAFLVTNAGRAAEPGSASPRNLEGVTLGDQMRLATHSSSKVVAMSDKDRSAALPGGRRPSGAYWFEPRAGGFVTSDYYLPELPAWVARFNDEKRPDRYFGKTWDLLLPPEAYERQGHMPAERSQLGEDFPYVVTGGLDRPGDEFYRTFELTPFASEHLAAFADAAVAAESLGADEAPDLLAISFSATDLIGHAYGPDSREVEDMFLRLDRVLAELLDAIDRRVGLDKTLVALTGDHGVCPVPEYLASLGIDAGRIAPDVVAEAMERAFRARFGSGDWVLSFVNDQAYLNLELLARRKVDRREAERLAGEAALSIPGVIGFFARSQILEGRMPEGVLARRIANGFHRRRSGDVWVLAKPFYVVSEWEGGTTHHSPYGYDTHVPLVLSGPAIRPGRYFGDSSPSDLAPTVAAVLGIEAPPQAVGRVLDEALAAPAAR